MTVFREIVEAANAPDSIIRKETSLNSTPPR
jgi:hypothetical protein